MLKSLPKNTQYNYVSDRTRTKVEIVRFDGPEGPVVIRRYSRDGSNSEESISSEMLWRAANGISEDTPVNFDRLFGGSYNTRSALEALLAHTQEFYWCKPGRIELIRDSTTIKKGHKHLVWKPKQPHELGIIYGIEGFEAISELPQQQVLYDALTGPTPQHGLDIEVQRRHLQIQIALIEIGRMLGFRTWVAQNDKGYQYGQKKIGEMEGVIGRLDDERVLTSYPAAIEAAKLIDCVWFKNGRLMPAVMEVEHSTGVTSGLTRMQKFKNFAPALSGIRWVIVAPDEDRNMVIRKASDPQFQSLQAQYFPYSAVEELYSLCQRRRISGKAVNEEFLDGFMEPCLTG